jgi:alpha-1,2-glucosyltransferase
MLYFWPYIILFSIPLVITPVLLALVAFFNNRFTANYKKYVVDRPNGVFPGIRFATLFITCGHLAVRYNTMIHPYTLADNRHYVFYVFRILRTNPAIRYLAVPLYYICAWMSVQSLVTPPRNEAQVKRKTSKDRPMPKSMQRECRTSFVVVWIAATTLSVATAPLVEPRYFIIPWIIWRLNVPYVSELKTKAETSNRGPYDVRLVLETAWLVVINMLIGYNFLYRGFSWPNEPDKIQRFLW